MTDPSQQSPFGSAVVQLNLLVTLLGRATKADIGVTPGMPACGLLRRARHEKPASSQLLSVSSWDRRRRAYVPVPMLSSIPYLISVNPGTGASFGTSWEEADEAHRQGEEN